MAQGMPEAPGTRVLVAGATGYLGRYVVKALHENGFWVRALSRPASQHKLPATSTDEVFVGNATDYGSLAGVCDGVEVAFSSVGIRSFGPRPTFWEVDFAANLNLLRRAKEAGVRHFIFVSVLHGDELRDRNQVAQARELVVDALKASGMTWTVVRPTGYFNDMAELFHMAQRYGLYFVMGDGTSEINPIHGADLAGVVVRGVKDSSLENQAIGVGGPDTFTYREIGELAFQVLGRSPRIVSVPPALIEAGSNLMAPFNLNAAALTKALKLMLDLDAVGTAVGTHHLKDFFVQLREGQTI